MIKLLIVDDMPIFLEYLKTCIDWKAYGFEIVGEATNGRDAFEKAIILLPDIVITDITMPYEDGLALSEKLKEFNNDISIVLITGNTEFEYARRAIKLGVSDYIVKPFEKEELLMTLINLQDNINRALEHRLQQEDEKEILKLHSLQKLIYNKGEKDISHTLDNLIELRDYNYFWALVIELESENEQWHFYEKAMNWKKLIGNLYRDYMGDMESKFTFDDFEGHVVIIHGLKRLTDDYYDKDDLACFIAFVRDRLSLNITIGIGSLISNIGEIRTTYLQAITALAKRFQLGGNRVISYDEISSDEKNYGFYSAEINEQILNHLQQNNIDCVVKIIFDIYKTVDENNFSEEYRNMMYMGLISLLLSHIVKIGKNIEDVFSKEFKPFSDFNSQLETDKRRYILSLYQRAIDFMIINKDTRSEQIARDAKRIIDENYFDFELNIPFISKSLLVNQTYLRKMFKDEMGMTLLDYLTKVRMEKARAYIVDGCYKLSAISEMVGYKDAGYFSKCFKNYFGVSPSDYKSF